jgi:hypothetical protein
VNVSLYLENRIKGLTLATSATYQHLSVLAANYSEGSISLACRIIRRKRKLKKMSPWKRSRVIKEMAGAYYLLRRDLDEGVVDKIIVNVERLLQTRYMASSAIEGFNAGFRSYL